MNPTPSATGKGGAVLTTLLLLPLAAVAQEADVRQQIEELKQGQQQIRRDLAEIKRLLQQAPRGNQAARSPVEGRLFQLGENPVVGAAAAKLTLVEFTDYQ